jgi:hypothetical protein
VQSQSNKPKKTSNCIEKKLKFEKNYVLSFKTMEIMEVVVFIQINVKEFKPKINLMKI